MKAFLSTQNDGLEPEEWKIICERFPRYPEENPVEAIWLQLKRLSTRAKLIVHFSQSRASHRYRGSLVYNRVVNIQFILPTYLLRIFYRFGKSFKIINQLFQLLAKYNLFNFPNLKKFDAFSQFI